MPLSLSQLLGSYNQTGSRPSISSQLAAAGAQQGYSNPLTGQPFANVPGAGSGSTPPGIVPPAQGAPAPTAAPPALPPGPGASDQDRDVPVPAPAAPQGGLDPNNTPPLPPPGTESPTSNPYDLTSLEGILASLNDPNRPPLNDPGIFEALLPHILSGSGGSLPIAFKPGDFGDTSNENAALAALGGPLFRDTGIGPAGGDILGFALNLGLGDFIEGGERGSEIDSIYRNIVNESAGSPAAGLIPTLAAGAEGLANPGALNARYGDLEQTLREDSAAALNRSRNRLSDMGVSGAGQAPAMMATESNANRDLARSLLSLQSMREQEMRSNLGAAGDAGRTSSDLFTALRTSPQLNLAGRLGQSQNPQSLMFQDALERAAQMATGTALANREASDFEKVAPILGSVIGAAGDIYGGWLGGR